MTCDEWIAQAHARILQAQDCIQEAARTSSRETFWHRLECEAQEAKETIAFLKEGIRLVQQTQETQGETHE